ncbi:hypothetical protein KR009_007288, partial [Drosophila setifemur]
ILNLSVSILLIGITDLAAGCECNCPLCGPGGPACKGCPERVPLCTELINQVQKLQLRIRQCVCGEPTWMI